MPFTLDAVHTAAMKLPDVSVGMKWRHRTWLVNDKGFIWDRPLGKTDLERFGDAVPPSGPILAARVENLDAKDALLSMGLPGFFTIQHFNGYPAVLIELRKARAADVRMAIEQAYRVVAASRPKPAKRRVTARTARRTARGS
jgi:hypothetical protein